ncbi:MAG TPA: translocation/assembly module TamB domain-containing protein, partial [Polyangia bacterium]|nr:translocation/assembly module TamB domain-containing protein [Polyangia bacterium]
DATLDAIKLKLASDLSLSDFTTDSFVPTGVQPLAGGKLAGRLHADATLGPGPPSVVVRNLDLTLTRRRAGGLPREIRVHGQASLSPTRVNTTGLQVEVPGARATAAGDLNPVRQTVALSLDVVAYDLALLLGSLKLPPLARSAELHAKLDGPLMSPTMAGGATVTRLEVGGRMVPELRTQFGLDKGLARLDSLRGELFGGHIEGKGTLRLFERSARRMLPSPIVDADLHLRNIDLAAASGQDTLAGRISLDAHAQGPLNAPSAWLRVPGGQAVTVAGQPLLVGPIDATLENQVATIHRLRLGRTDGASIEITGSAGLRDQRLALDVVLKDLALDTIPGVAEADLAIHGTAAAQLHIAGTVERPELSGVVELTGVGARGVPLGTARIELTPENSAAGPGVAVKGDLFQQLKLDAHAANSAAGPVIRAAVEFEKLALETLLPELTNLGDGRGIATGRVQVDIAPGKPLAADVRLSELAVSLARAVEAAPGEPTTRRVDVRATKPIHVAVNGDHVTLDPLDLATTGGDLHARGALDGDKIAGEIDGHLDLELLQPFLIGRVERLTGAMDVNLRAAGSLKRPDLGGRLVISQPVRVRPTGFDTDLVIGGGVITLDPAGAAVSDLAVTIDGSTTKLDGRVTLGAGFTPETVDAKLAGDISARFLGSLAGGAVSDAQGRARIKAAVKGRLDSPTVNAWLGLGTITFRVRSSGTEVEVKSGVVEINNTGAELRNVRVVLDDQGTLIIGAAGVRPGRVSFKKLVPLTLGEVDVPLHGEQLTTRSPNVYEINDLAFDLDLEGNMDEGFQLGGEVRIIAGRYVQDFKLGNLVLSPRVNESAIRPFYYGKPLLENLALDLNVRTLGDAFVVQNNIAPEIHIDVALRVGGTLAQPVLAGEVRPTDGRFQIPVLRGEFDLVPNVSHVTFVETKSLADGETPEINIEAQNPVIDASGAEHNVRMNIHGPVREMQIDLSTDDGLDRNQTALLLLTGRTSTASDRVATQNPTVGANIGTGLDIAGQATRDAIANLMEPIIGDTFERAFGLQLRLTVGPDGFEGRLRKRISRYTNFQADGLWGFQGQSRMTLHFEQWLRDYITVSTGAQRLVLSQQQGPGEALPINFNLELRWDYAIRM